MKESQTKLTFVLKAHVSCLICLLYVHILLLNGHAHTVYVQSLVQVMLVGPRGHLVFVAALVGRMALLWPPENAMVPRSAAVEREPAQKTAPVLLVRVAVTN